MSLITCNSLVDHREVAKRIKTWLEAKSFETTALESNGSYVVKARKKGVFRSVIGADRALEVGVRQFDGLTQVDIRQGSWKTNVISNAAWILVTGGANLLISGWSIVIQKELEAFVRSVFEELSGTRQVEL